MTPKLTDEMRQALQTQPSGPVKISDDQTQKIYVLIDVEIHQRAMEALRQKDDHDAIARGIAQMEAGEEIPLEEAFNGIRAELNLRRREQ